MKTEALISPLKVSTRGGGLRQWGYSPRYLWRGTQRSGSSRGDRSSQILSGVCPSWKRLLSPHWVRMSTQSDLRRCEGRGSEVSVSPPTRLLRVLTCYYKQKLPYLQITLPLDLWQGLICREHATAFHMSGRHFLMSSTGMFMKGILMVPLDHSLMSFKAPWSDWTLQLRNSSVGLWAEAGDPQRTRLMGSGPAGICVLPHDKRHRHPDARMLGKDSRPREHL